MNKKLNGNWIIISTMIIIGTTISCAPRTSLTFKNQTAQNIDLYADTLYLMTIKPNSTERGAYLGYKAATWLFDYYNP